MIVTRSPACSSTAVAEPGRTHHVSKLRSTGRSPAISEGGVAWTRHAFAAGSFASSLSACSMSFLARSRLPAESSFFTSFSTTRRL